MHGIYPPPCHGRLRVLHMGGYQCVVYTPPHVTVGFASYTWVGMIDLVGAVLQVVEIDDTDDAHTPALR